MSIEDGRAAVADALSTIDGLRASPYLRDQVNPPEAMVDYDVDYSQDFDGAAVYDVSVLVFMQRTSERASQQFLDDLRDPTSSTGIKYVLEHDADVAAAFDYFTVKGSNRQVEALVGNVSYLLSVFNCEACL